MAGGSDLTTQEAYEAMTVLLEGGAGEAQIGGLLVALKMKGETAAELAGAPVPKGLDGISIVPTLHGKPQNPHDYFYWEFHEKGFHQALRFGRWKAIRHGLNAPIALYDLHNDIGETTDLADQHPQQVARAKELLA